MGDSDLLDRFDTDLLVIFAFILAVILVVNAPYLLAVLGGLVFAAWLLVQFGVFDDEEESEPSEPESPLERLQTRYAEGKIDEEEFERRLTRILDADEVARYERLRERETSDTGAGDVDTLAERDLETDRNR